MHLQTNIFWEDEHSDSFSVIKKYFNDITILDKYDIAIGNIPKNIDKVRGSLMLLTRLKRLHKWTDALIWAPALRNYMFSNEFYFIDFKGLINSNIEYPIFTKPTSGNKDFSGNVYTKEKLISEYNFAINNKNIDPYTICMVNKPVKINQEYRLIFIEDEYISGSRYMINGEISIDSGVPQDVIEYGKKVAKDNFFLNKFDYVIDIGINDDKIGLVEINQFETSSFYSADLDKIYSRYKEV